MCHDATHCADVNESCPADCYRKQLDDDLKKIGGYKWPLSYSNLRETSICPLNRKEGSDG